MAIPAPALPDSRPVPEKVMAASAVVDVGGIGGSEIHAGIRVLLAKDGTPGLNAHGPALCPIGRVVRYELDSCISADRLGSRVHEALMQISRRGLETDADNQIAHAWQGDGLPSRQRPP
jgi:hypothetical protein